MGTAFQGEGGPLIGYDYTKTAQSGITGTSTLVSWTPGTPTNAPFQWTAGQGLFGAVYDPIMYLGYNASVLFAQGQAGEPGLSMGIEGNYFAANFAGLGADKNTVEWYVQYHSPDHTTTVYRPIGFTAGRDTNATKWCRMSIELGTEATALSQLDINGTANIATFNNQAINFNEPVSFNAYIVGIFRADATSLTLNSTVTNNAHCQFATDGTVKWYLANFRGDAAGYIWDNTNARFQVKMTFGNTVGASITEFNGQLKTNGGRVKYVLVVTDTATLDATHNVVVCNKGTAMTINLPAVASNAGRTYIIKNKGAGVVTVDGNASEQIDNAATLALNQWQTATIVCDGAIWCVI